MSSKDHDLIIAEIRQAINKLGGSAEPATPDEARLALRRLGADVDLRSIVDSWGDTLPDEQILYLLRNWNAGVPRCALPLMYCPSTQYQPTYLLHIG